MRFGAAESAHAQVWVRADATDVGWARRSTLLWSSLSGLMLLVPALGARPATKKRKRRHVLWNHFSGPRGRETPRAGTVLPFYFRSIRVTRISASAAPSSRARVYHFNAAAGSPRTPLRRACARNEGSNVSPILSAACAFPASAARS